MSAPEIGSKAIDDTIIPMDVEFSSDQPIPEALEALANMAVPEGRLDPHCLTPPRKVAERVAEVAERVLDPNLVLEAMQVALKFEKNRMKELEELENKTQGYLDTIDNLLELNAKLASLPDKDQTLPPEVQEQFAKLKEKGIDLWNENTISKEKRSEIKTLIHSHIDKLRTRITMTFNNMQSVIQAMNSVNDTVKNILQQHVRQLMATLTRNQRAGS